MVKGNIYKYQGFTLIELMLASALLMTVMFAGYYGYSLYSQKWQKRVDLYWLSTQQGIGLDALNRLFLSASTYVIKNDEGKESVYFEATQNEIRFVTNSPILSTGTALIELEIINIGNSKQLIYREKSLSSAPLYLLSELEGVSEWQQEVVLLNDIEQVQWSFYGWTSFQEAIQQAQIAEVSGNKDLRKSYQIHELNKIRVMPVHVNLDIKYNDRDSKLTIAMPNHTIFSVLANTRSDA